MRIIFAGTLYERLLKVLAIGCRAIPWSICDAIASAGADIMHGILDQ